MTRRSSLALAVAFAVPSFASADVAPKFTNPLLAGVPASAVGFLSIDLGTKSKPLTQILAQVEKATGSKLGPLAASGLQMLGAPDSTVQAFGAQMDSRVVVFATNVNWTNPDPAKLMKSIVVLAGLHSGASVAHSLATSTLPTGHDSGIHYFKLGSDIDALVEGKTLILGQDPANIAAAVKALRGGPRLATSHIAALASRYIEPDAQILAWMPNMSPGSASTSGQSVNITTSTSFGFSLALRPKGISFSVGPVRISSSDTKFDLSKVRLLPSDYVRRLPAGAYMILAIANPWPAIRANNVLNNVPGDYGNVINSLSGDLTLGLYPSALKHNKAEGLDLLVELHPTGGNDPAHSLRAAIALVMKSTLPGDEPPIQKFHVAGVQTAYRLNGGLTSLLHSAMKSFLTSPKANSLIAGKNIAIATVGKSVIFASSEQTLRRAVAAERTGGPSLADDPQYTELANDAKHHRSTATFAMSPTHIIEGISDLVSRFKIPGLDVNGFNQYKQMLGNWPSPLFIRLTVANHDVSARLFIPVDVNQLITAAGSIGTKK